MVTWAISSNWAWNVEHTAAHFAKLTRNVLRMWWKNSIIPDQFLNLLNVCTSFRSGSREREWFILSWCVCVCFFIIYKICHILIENHCIRINMQHRHFSLVWFEYAFWWEWSYCLIFQSTMKQRLVCAKCSEYFTFSVFSPAFSFQYRSIDVMIEREGEKVHGKNANCTPSVQRFRTISMVMRY